MNPIQQAIEQATAARDWLPTICGELSGLDVPEDDANMRAAIAGLERVEGEIDAALTSLRSLNKEVEGVELPPLPEAQIVSYQTDSTTMRTAKLRTYDEADLRAYARAAIAADREKHGEVVAFMWRHKDTGLTRTIAKDSIATVDESKWEPVGPLYLAPQPTPQERQDAARLDWLQKAADARKVELAKSIMGTGYEIGEWPSMRVTVKSGSLRDAIDEAMSKEPQR